MHMAEQKEYKNLYREIVTNLLEGVMVISMNGKITMLNPAAERMLGLTQEVTGITGPAAGRMRAPWCRGCAICTTAGWTPCAARILG